MQENNPNISIEESNNNDNNNDNINKANLNKHHDHDSQVKSNESVFDSTLEMPKPQAINNNDNNAKASKLVDSPHTFELFRDYIVPEWSSKPNKQFFLEIIKEGVVIEEKDIYEKPFYLIGKYSDLCDIVLEHMSISRKHAIIQHKNTDEVYIYDLGSANGTLVNMKSLPPKTFVKLHIGDVIKFGQSTRLYILGAHGENLNDDDDVIEEGAKIDEKANHKKTLKNQYLKLLGRQSGINPVKHREQREQRELKVTTNNSNEGISWGMIDEEEIYAYNEEEEIKLDVELLRKLENLSDKDLERIDNYEKKLRKFQNLENEFNLLNKKEVERYGLSESDRYKKEQLQNKVNEMGTQLDILEENLRFALFDESKQKKQESKYKESNDTFGDDDFYDRVSKKKPKVDINNNTTKTVTMTKQNIIEDFNSLKNKLEKLIEKRQELNMQILNYTTSNVKSKSDNQVVEKKDEGEEDDEFEKYMGQIENTLKNQSRDKLLKELKDVNEQIKQTQDLLKIVKPSYHPDSQKTELKAKEKSSETKHDLSTSSESSKLTSEMTTTPMTAISSHHLSKSKQKQLDKSEENQARYDRMVNQLGQSKPTESIILNEIIKEELEVQKMILSAAQKTESSKNQQQQQQKKVYGVDVKPASRNVREKEYESSASNTYEWMPPEESHSDGNTKLKKRLGY